MSLKVIACSGNPDFVKKLCAQLTLEPVRSTISKFADGEIGVAIHGSVRGCHVFVIQQFEEEVNERLMELFLTLDAIVRSSPARITVILPYFPYGRQDRKAMGGVPISSALVAKLIEKSGADQVLAVDLHAGQLQGFFRIPVDNLWGAPMFVGPFLRMKDLENVIVVSPDAGGVERADCFRTYLADALDCMIGMAVINKRRVIANEVASMELVGDVTDSDCIIVDDIIDTAGTLVKAAELLKDKGARRVFACASHGLFHGPACERIASSVLESVYVTDSVCIRKKMTCEKVKVVSIARLIAEAVRRMYHGESLSTLFSVESV